jgi:hypothetical protein
MYCGGTLIVTTKKRLDDWERGVRAVEDASFHRYTDTLSKRRQLGPFKLSQLNFVITTFDVGVACFLLPQPLSSS